MIVGMCYINKVALGHDKLGIRALCSRVLGCRKVTLSKISFMSVKCVIPMKKRLQRVLRKISILLFLTRAIECELY